MGLAKHRVGLMLREELHWSCPVPCESLLKPETQKQDRPCPFAILQSGGWVSGTPEWLPAARIFLAASIIGGYFVSAAFFLTSAHFMGQDQAKLETVLQTGTLDSVRLIRCSCLQSCHPAVVAESVPGILSIVISS